MMYVCSYGNKLLNSLINLRTNNFISLPLNTCKYLLSKEFQRDLNIKYSLEFFIFQRDLNIKYSKVTNN